MVKSSIRSLPLWRLSSSLLPTLTISLLLLLIWWTVAVHAQDIVTASEGAVSFPTYTLEPLNFSVSYRQNVCDRQAAFHAGNVTLRNALEGFQLRPYFLMDIRNFSPTDANGSIPLDSREPSIRILDELARRAKFTWRDSYGASSYNDALTFQEQREVHMDTAGRRQRVNRYQVNFDNIINWAAQSFDIAGNEFSKTLSRVANGSSFIEGHVDASIIMIGKKAEETRKVDLFSFLEPFDWQVWMLTVLTMIVAGFVYQWMEWINHDSDEQELQHEPAETIYFAMLSFNGDIKFQPKSNYARVFVLLLAFWGLILSSAYTANLASFLVVQNAPLTQVETVGDAVASNLPICMVQGSSQEEEVLSKYPNARIVAVPPTTPNQIFTDVLKGRCKLAVAPIFLWDVAKRNRTINVGCKLRWAGRTFKFVKSGFATRSDSGTFCTNLIRDVLSVHISEMVDDGTIDTIYRQYFRSIHTVDCNRAEDTIVFSDEQVDLEGGQQQVSSLPSQEDDPEFVSSLSLQDLGGLFIVVYCFGFVSCVVALIKWYQKRDKKPIPMSSRFLSAKDDPDLEEDTPSTDEEQVLPEDKNDGKADGGDVAGREQLLSKLEIMRLELEELQSMVSRKND